MTRANDDAAEMLNRNTPAPIEPARTLSGFQIAQIRSALEQADISLEAITNSKVPGYQRGNAREARIKVRAAWGYVAPLPAAKDKP